MCERTQITRDHPDYDAVTTILRNQPDLLMSEPSFIRVPDERAWIVHPDHGRPYLEVEVWALDADGRLRILDDDAVIEAERRKVWID